MRDLEIRGAGEILGSRQHGHITAVGFELYCRLLAQAVEALKTQGPDAIPEVGEIETPPLVDLPVQAYLPDDYIPDESLRLRMYQRLSSLGDEKELEVVRSELEDRFGIVPRPVEDLLYVLQVRLLAMQAGVQAIAREDGNLVLRLSPQAQHRAKEIVTHFGQRAWVGRGQMWLALSKITSDWRTMLTALLLRLQNPDSQRNGKRDR
jgi:transcription-repair coupling factor (superfamily II helicase)